MIKQRLVIDEEVPYMKNILEPYADVVYMKGSAIDRRSLEGAHGLIIRTRTLCTPALLEGTDVTFIGTATIGTDHIDMEYCRRSGIHVASAAGCNAGAVAQYVLTAMVSMAYRQRKRLENMTLGIIGVGNVGSKVAQMALALGMRVLLNDPPRALKEGNAGFTSLECLLTQADVISLHVPLQPDTVHMVDARFFERLVRTPLFINTSRGAIVDEAALMCFAPKVSGVVLDVWENEPAISKAVLDAASIATPHIAGYSVEGKRKATVMMVRELAAFFGWKALKNFSLPSIPAQRITFSDVVKNGDEALYLLLNKVFPIFEEDFKLRLAPDRFEALRSEYLYRRENSGCQIKGTAVEEIPLGVLQAIGFGKTLEGKV